MSVLFRLLIPRRIVSWFDPPIPQTWAKYAPVGRTATLYALATVYEDCGRILRDPELANEVLRRIGKDAQ